METTSTTLAFTTAPADYDGFNTRDLGTVGADDRGRAVRLVRIEGRHFEWQSGRYGSGMHATVPAEDAAMVDRFLGGPRPSWRLVPERVALVVAAAVARAEEAWSAAEGALEAALDLDSAGAAPQADRERLVAACARHAARAECRAS